MIAVESIRPCFQHIYYKISPIDTKIKAVKAGQTDRQTDRQTHRQTDKVGRSHSLPDCDDKSNMHRKYQKSHFEEACLDLEIIKIHSIGHFGNIINKHMSSVFHRKSYH